MLLVDFLGASGEPEMDLLPGPGHLLLLKIAVLGGAYARPAGAGKSLGRPSQVFWVTSPGLSSC